MLHAIDEQGMIFWHCRKPTCSYHNCASWDREVQCEAHAEKKTEGQTHSTHISDSAIYWKAPDQIVLPECSECSEHQEIYVRDQIAEPIIRRDENGEILQVTMPEGREHHGNLWVKDADIVHVATPHPTLAHLSLEEIGALQERIKMQAPNAPTDWMLTVTPHEKIHHVYQHPAIARHQEIARQLEAMGKVWKEPEPEPIEPMVPLSQVKQLVQDVLRQHGITPLDDTDKQPAIQS